MKELVYQEIKQVWLMAKHSKQYRTGELGTEVVPDAVLNKYHLLLNKSTMQNDCPGAKDLKLPCRILLSYDFFQYSVHEVNEI